MNFNVTKQIRFFALPILFILSINLNLLAQTVKTVGTSANYTTLKDAFDAINAGTITGEIELQITTNLTELYQSGYTGSGGTSDYSSIKIYPTSSDISVSGNLDAPLIDLNGAGHVVIDGRVNAVGNTRSLIISNSSISNLNFTSTLRFINDASGNTVKYSTIKGASTNYYFGVILFATTTYSTGNDDNTIENNDITSATSRPTNAIFSDGTPLKPNSGNVISNNNIYDIYNSGLSSYGIYLFQHNTDWIISTNSFFEQNDFIPTQNIVKFGAIKIEDGSNYTITNNYIGGKSALCGGTSLTKTSARNNVYTAIQLNDDMVGTSSIQGNTIKNINWSNSGDATWTAINILGGNVNIGTTTGNNIGTSTDNGSISVTGGSTMDFYGIKLAGTGTISCENNSIGSITLYNNLPDSASNFYGIYKTLEAGTTTISNNTIGSSTVANSIHSNSQSLTAPQSLRAIYLNGTGVNTISNNLIANLTNGTVNSTANIQFAYTRGIVSTRGINNIINNTIHSLKTASASNPAIYGLIAWGNLDLTTISGNTIYNISNHYCPVINQR